MLTKLEKTGLWGLIIWLCGGGILLAELVIRNEKGNPLIVQWFLLGVAGGVVAFAVGCWDYNLRKKD